MSAVTSLEGVYDCVCLERLEGGAGGRVWSGRLEGVWRASGVCLECVWRVRVAHACNSQYEEGNDLHVSAHRMRHLHE